MHPFHALGANRRHRRGGHLAHSDLYNNKPEPQLTFENNKGSWWAPSADHLFTSHWEPSVATYYNPITACLHEPTPGEDSTEEAVSVSVSAPPVSSGGGKSLRLWGGKGRKGSWKGFEAVEAEAVIQTPTASSGRGKGGSQAHSSGAYGYDEDEEVGSSQRKSTHLARGATSSSSASASKHLQHGAARGNKAHHHNHHHQATEPIQPQTASATPPALPVATSSSAVAANTNVNPVQPSSLSAKPTASAAAPAKPSRVRDWGGGLNRDELARRVALGIARCKNPSLVVKHAQQRSAMAATPSNHPETSTPEQGAAKSGEKRMTLRDPGEVGRFAQIAGFTRRPAAAHRVVEAVPRTWRGPLSGKVVKPVVRQKLVTVDAADMDATGVVKPGDGGLESVDERSVTDADTSMEVKNEEYGDTGRSVRESGRPVRKGAGQKGREWLVGIKVCVPIALVGLRMSLCVG
jgi:hypothetical protein